MRNQLIILIVSLFCGTVTSLQAQDPGLIEIPFELNQSGLPIVELSVLGYSSPFIFDTGASMVSFRKRLADSLQQRSTSGRISFVSKTKTTLANGQTVEAQLVKIDWLSLGGFPIKNVDALIIDSDDAIPLIGQNILKEFQSYKIDLVARRIVLEQKSKTTLKKLRFIPCDISDLATVDRIRAIIENDQSLNIGAIEQESNVPPPANALARIRSKYTIRYFDRDDIAVAEAMKQKLQANGVSATELGIEDMTQFFSSAIPGYLEIWVKQNNK